MNAVRAIGLGCLAVAVAGCYREKREFEPPPGAAAAATIAATSLQAGPGKPLGAASQPRVEAQRTDENAFLVNQGKRLFRWYNCNGCHAQGGGGMGVALMDDKWRYGAAPAAIYASIAEGRPNGMPAFGGRVPEDEIWQLVAYVRALSGQLRKDVAPSRSDGFAGAPVENVRDEERPLIRPAAQPKPAPVTAPPAAASNPP